VTSQQRSTFTSVILPFIIFTGIWGSTWIVIRDQLGAVPPQWSVTYRFIIAAAVMALAARPGQLERRFVPRLHPVRDELQPRLSG
jgi:drug/metabolite transporter (DMT)-like permease